MSDIKVSVIVPVYNVERYLTKCLNSIVNQTLKEIEIICIDDGSTDQSPQILDEYSLKDNRIKVIHKINEGYGKTMNTGLRMAIGEYIGIVESDDWIEPNMYEELFNVASDNDLDFVQSDYYESWENMNYRIYLSVNIEPSFYNIIIKRYERDPFINLSAQWTGLYRNTYLKENNIKYNESPGASYQDIGFLVQNRIMYNKIMFINKAFYNYRQDNPSSSVKDKAKVMAYTNEYDYVESLLMKRDCYIHNTSIYNYLRLKGHIHTFIRIDDSLKYDYCLYIQKDYNSRKKYISESLFNQDRSTFDTLIKISRNPGEYCNQIIKKKHDSLERLRSEREYIVYGTGIRAGRVTNILYINNLYKHIIGYAMTEKGEIRNFGYLPVYNIEDLLEYKDALVLIAVKKGTKAYDEIKANLDRLGFTNYMDTEGLVYLN